MVRPILRSALRLARLYHRGAANALRPIVRNLHFDFPLLPSHLDGFRILHLSDLHIDGMAGLAEILIAQLRGIEADLCVITGDYRFEMNGACDDVYPRLEAILSAVRTPNPIFGILGNHDELGMAPRLADTGIRMLINEAEEVADGLWLGGAHDADDGGIDGVFTALDSAPEEALWILLAHTPEIYVPAEAAGVDLYLCGHTHGGQICLPWIGAPLVNAACPRAYARGRWRHGRMHGYTTTGLGCSLIPVRYNCPPEIVLIELHRARHD